MTFNYNRFNPFFGEAGSLFELLLIGLSNWYNTVTFYQFEGVYDPSYLNLNKNDRNSWKIYRDKIKSIYIKLLKVQNTEELEYKDVKDYANIYKKELNNLKRNY